MHVSTYFFCFKQKTAYELRISDWSSDVCSSDLPTTRSATAWSWTAPNRPGSATTSSIRTRRTEIQGFLTRQRDGARGRRRRFRITLADRKSVVSGERVSVRGDLGGRRLIKKKSSKTRTMTSNLVTMGKNI